MGNKNHDSYSSYDYYSSSKNEYEEEEEVISNEDKAKYLKEQIIESNKINENDINEYTEYTSSTGEKIIKALDKMNLSSEQVQENFDFYKKNFAKLLKINKLVSNIKKAELSNFKPRDILVRLVPESDTYDKKILDSPEYGELERLTKELLNDYEILPEYALPDKWEELFKLETHNTAIEKLLIQSEIERIIKEYGEFSENNYKSVINQENYKNYDKELEQLKIKQLELKISRIKELKYFNVSERQILKNIKYYSDNFEQFFKIDGIIGFIKANGLSYLSPYEFIKKYYLDQPKDGYPEEWQKLFDIADKEDNIKQLENAIIYIQMHDVLEKEKVEKMKQEEKEEKERLKEKEEKRRKADIKKNIVEKIQALKHFSLGSVWIKDKKNYYIKNYESFVKIDQMIDMAKEAGFFNTKPEVIYKKAYGHEKCEADDWKALFKLKHSKEDIDDLFIAVKVEYLKRRLGEYQESYNYYSTLIEPSNYEYYEKQWDNIQEVRKILDRISNNKQKVNTDKYHYFQSYQIDNINKLNEEYSKANLNAKSDMATIEKFDKEYREWKEIKLRKVREEEEEEEERRREEAAERRAMKESAERSRNNELKKVYVKLCTSCYCDSKCLGCGVKLSGAHNISNKGSYLGYALHAKCQTSTCFVCRKKNGEERSSTHLCKSCYQSGKYNVYKCIWCGGDFK